MKILYNVTIKIDSSLEADWVDWMKNIHIPEVMATECFEAFKLTRIIGDTDEHGIGFAIQYIAPSMSEFEKYQENYAKKLQEKHTKRYQNRYVAFRTLMQVEAES